jgi:hypothetical protein
MKYIPKPVLPVPGDIAGNRFADLDDSMVTAHRSIYFDERQLAGRRAPGGGLNFFVTVKGQQEVAYYPEEPPAITTTLGAVEDWTIENHTAEVHEFHIHQIHFELIAVNGVPIPKDQRQWYDTHQVGYYTGKGKYPSITVRMDFRGAVAGEFVYHCHILDHEDGGMMANILVLPRGGGGKHAQSQEHQPNGAKLIKIGAQSAPSHA